jgi:hypothetical protein
LSRYFANEGFSTTPTSPTSTPPTARRSSSPPNAKRPT